MHGQAEGGSIPARPSDPTYGGARRIRIGRSFAHAFPPARDGASKASGLWMVEAVVEGEGPGFRAARRHLRYLTEAKAMEDAAALLLGHAASRHEMAAMIMAGVAPLTFAEGGQRLFRSGVPADGRRAVPSARFGCDRMVRQLIYYMPRYDPCACLRATGFFRHSFRGGLPRRVRRRDGLCA